GMHLVGHRFRGQISHDRAAVGAGQFRGRAIAKGYGFVDYGRVAADRDGTSSCSFAGEYGEGVDSSGAAGFRCSSRAGRTSLGPIDTREAIGSSANFVPARG